MKTPKLFFIIILLVFSFGFSLMAEAIDDTVSVSVNYVNLYASPTVQPSAYLNATVGVPFTMSATIYNGGSAGASNFPYFFNIAPNVPDGGDGTGTIELPYGTISSLAAGSNTSVTGSYTFTSPGTHSFQTVVDLTSRNPVSGGVITESNEDDNSSWWTNVTVVASIPTVSTSTISSITQTSASGGGNITSNGGSSITARGIVWSTSSNPTIANTKTTDGTGNGTFTSSMSSLVCGTTYHVRAYATNSAGTAYGSDVSFTTSVCSSVPTVTTNSISSITQTSASGGGNVTSNGGSTVTVSGIVWGTSANPTTSSYVGRTTDGWAIGSWSDSITLLSANTTYHVRAYATNSVGTAYGSDVSFTTTAYAGCSLPWGGSISNGGSTTAYSSPSVVYGSSCTYESRTCSNGSLSGTYQYGSCYMESASSCSSPCGIISSGSSCTAYLSSSVTSPSTCTSQSRTCSNGSLSGTYQYGSCSVGASIPTVSTSTISSITQTSASGGGTIDSNGGATVTVSGIVWHVNANPTTSLYTGKTTNGWAIGGPWSSSMTNLTPGVTYYVRAYATNSAGTAYGPNVSFTTGVSTVPVLTTNSATSITETGAISGGNITSDGSSTVTVSGIVWGTSANPTTSSYVGRTTDGWAIGGPWSSSMTNLTPGVTYYVRAYATNSAGTAYGLNVTFTTVTAPNTKPNPPTISA